MMLYFIAACTFFSLLVTAFCLIRIASLEEQIILLVDHLDNRQEKIPEEELVALDLEKRLQQLQNKQFSYMNINHRR